MKGKPKVIAFRRKREGKTDYKQRLRLVASDKPRLVIRRSNLHIITQIVEFHPDGDKVLITTTSKELQKFGWKMSTKNTPAAYLTGLLCGVKAKAAKIKTAITDIGLNRSQKGGVIYAALKGAIDSGLDIPHNETALPEESRISGKHIAEYAKSMDKSKQGNQFSKYIKTGIKPEDISKQFESAKAKILKEKQ